MNGQYCIENSFQLFGPNGYTGFFIVAGHIFGPNSMHTGYWINEVNNRIVRPDGSDSGFWISDGRIYGTGTAPWLS